MKFRDFIKRISLFALLQSSASGAKPYNPCAEFGFDVIEGNPSLETKRWLIGENHLFRDQTAMCITALLNSLEGEKTLFLEGYDHGPISAERCQAFVNVNLDEENTLCYGWDDTSLMAESEEYRKDGGFRANLFGVKMMHDKKKASDSTWDAKYEFMLSDKSTFPPDVDVQKIKRYCAIILERRKKGLTYDQIFEEEFKAPSSMDNHPSTQAAIFKRDQALVRALRANSPHKKAILVAGSFHLHQSTNFFTNEPKARDYVKKEMRKDKTSYAILKFKS